MSQLFYVSVVFKGAGRGFQWHIDRNRKYRDFLEELFPGKYWWMTDAEYESSDQWEGFLGRKLKQRGPCDLIVWTFPPGPEDLGMAKKHCPDAEQIVLEIAKCTS